MKDPKREVIAHYDKRAGELSKGELAAKERRMKRLYERVLAAVRISRDAAVGVIGSSTGTLPLYVSPRAGTVIGVDLSEVSIAVAERRRQERGVTNVEYRTGDAEALPLPDGCLDVALSDCVINLVPSKQRAFEEMHRVLRDGGMLVMADPVRRPGGADVSGLPAGGCIRDTVPAEEYRRVLEQVGFQKIVIEDITPLAREIWPDHQGEFDRYKLAYVLITAQKAPAA